MQTFIETSIDIDSYFIPTLPTTFPTEIIPNRIIL